MDLLFEPILQITDFFSPEECDACIQFANHIGFSRARLASKGRKNFESFSENPYLQNELITRLTTTLGMSGIVIPKRFEFYKYEQGDYIDAHIDGYTCISDSLISCKTIIIYLNDDFEGGSTAFPDSDISISPQRGTLVIFDQGNLIHIGKPVIRGFKYILRSNLGFASRL